MASENMKRRRLQELGESDFEIVEGQEDIRGWEVKNGQDQVIGEVEELILDAQLRKVRYMIVDLEDNDLDLDEKQVLIPIGLAELHKKEDEVILPGISTEQLGNLPEYDVDHLTPDVERAIAAALGRTGADATIPSMGAEPETHFYNHEHFQENNLYRRRRQEPGSEPGNSIGEPGMRFQDKMGQSGSEVEGYFGREDRPYEEDGDRRLRDQGIVEERAVPVNRNSQDDAEELRANLPDRKENEDRDDSENRPRGGRSI